MNTGPAQRLPYRELARQRARIRRAFAVTELERVARLLATPEQARDAGLESSTHVEVDLTFEADGEGLPWVRGEARVAVVMTCNRCAESVSYPLKSGFALCLVDELRASELAETRDVLVVSGPDVSIAEIVEDELLLALPERLCVEDPCRRLPAMAYPADTGVEQTQVQAAEGPFAALRELRDALEDERD